MSLYKQMAIVFTLFLLAVLGTVMVLNFKTASDFAQRQLYNQAKNTAHSLGLSISKATTSEDIVLMGRMIDAIFDSGSYEQILLKDVDGKTVYEKSVPVQVKNVPDWFIDFVPLKSVSASSSIMIGWKQFGSLHVKAHTGNAYAKLYQNFQDILTTFLVVGVVVLGLLYALLSLSLRPLGRIANQARAIIEHAFIIETRLPFTSELRTTTKAMNAMVHKVRDIFERESETLRRYHDLLYIDAQTKLHNRRYINATLPEYLQGETELANGVYALLSVDSALQFKEHYGHERYNELMQSIANKLQEKFDFFENKLMARLNESDFFLLIPLVQLEDIAKQMQDFMSFLQQSIKDQDNICHVGCSVGIYHTNETLKSLLSRADYGIMHAINSKNYKVHVSEYEEEISLGRQEWKEELLQSIQHSRIQLAHQSVICYKEDLKKTLHEEIFLRWVDAQGNTHSAGQFIPVAMQLGLVALLDRYMIEKVLDYMHNVKNHIFAINLSGDFFRSNEHMAWLQKKLKAQPLALRKRIWIEVHNSAASKDLDATLELAKLVKSMKCNFGLDHFSLQTQGIEYLQTLRPDYIKVGCDYLQDILVDAQTGQQRESLSNVATSLGITLIASNTEKITQFNTLKSIGITCFQGRYISGVDTFAI